MLHLPLVTKPSRPHGPRPTRRRWTCLAGLCAGLFLLPLLAGAQTLNIANDVQTVATVAANTTVTLTGKAELHVTGTGDPIPTCVIHLNSPDAWFFLDNILPSVANSTFLSRVRVSGAVAALNTNVRVVQYNMGTVIIPQAATFAPLQVFDGAGFTGRSKQLLQYTAYNDLLLGSMKLAISSFKLKRGYMATVAANENGTGASRNYVAADGDLEVSALPATLDNQIRFVRIFPWRWVSKKGTCDTDVVALKAGWRYNWDINLNSTLDWEYAAIKQQPYWPGLGQDWKARGVNHLLGFNEPNNPVEDAYVNLTPQGSSADAAARWPELLSTGLRVGAPAVTDGGYGWIVDFINQAEAAGHRVDYVPIHYYRSYPNNNNPAGAATNLYNFLKGIYDVVKRPIWVTEFNNGANWTGDPDPTFAQNKDVIEAMVNMMDSTPWIERYSLYSAVEEVRQVYYNAGGLTPMGVMYRDHVAPLAYKQEMPASGLSAAVHLNFEGDLRDALGNGNNGMAVGAPVFAAGKYGQAVALDGATDYLQLPDQVGDSTDFTFAAWVFWTGGNQWQRIFDFGSGPDQFLFLSPRSGGDTLRFAIKNGGAEQQLNWTGALPVNTWTHVAVTISGNTGKLFVNGALVNTNAAMTINPVDCATKFNYLGKSQFPDPLFAGRLDDVRCLTTALSDAQIATIAHATNGVPPAFAANPIIKPSAIKLQPYTESIAGSATGGVGAITYSKIGGPAWLAVAADGSLTGVPTATDGGVNSFAVRASNASGALHTTTLQITVGDPAGLTARYAFNNNPSAAVGTAHGTTSGSPVYTTGKYAQALDFDGVDDFVTLPYGVASFPEITCATWVYWDGGNQWQRIFDFGNGTADNFFLTPRAGGTNGLLFSISAGGVSQTVETGQLATGQWVHVAVTLGANTARLYVNGNLANTAAITLKPTDIEPATNYLGKSQWPDPYFNGRLDEFQIFGRVLTAAEVAALVAARAPVFTADPINKPAAAVDQTYEQTLAGSALDPDTGTTLTYSKVSGPKWLTVAPNGRLSGVPSATEAGMNRFLVRVTDSTLQADDAALNIDLPEPADLLVHYEFNNSLANSSGGAGAAATGGPVYTAGLFDQAIRLDGADDFVTLPASTVTGLNDITIAARVRWNGGSQWQRLFDFGNNTTQYLLLTPRSASNTLRFTITTSGNSAASEQRMETGQLVTGEWTHVAVALSGNTGTLYVNGAAVDTKPITIDPANFNPAFNYLGKAQFADPLFNGSIDDFRVYGRGLSAAEVSALASPPAAVTVPPSYLSWANALVFPGGLSGLNDDAEGDGVSNFLEWLFGSDPLTAGPGLLPQVAVRTAAELGGATVPGKTYLSFQARVRTVRPGVTLIPEAAATVEELSTPTAAAHAIQAGPPVADGDFQIYTYYYDVPLEDAPAGTGFLRLRVVQQ